MVLSGNLKAKQNRGIQTSPPYFIFAIKTTPLMEDKDNFYMEVIIMINFIALGITLVLAQLVTIAITYFVAFKVLTNKNVLKKYFKWVNEIIEMTQEEMDL